MSTTHGHTTPKEQPTCILRNFRHLFAMELLLQRAADGTIAGFSSWYKSDMLWTRQHITVAIFTPEFLKMQNFGFKSAPGSSGPYRWFDEQWKSVFCSSNCPSK
ncbi:hypothetical protein Tco_1311629 [Tanacetum coccineum]